MSEQKEKEKRWLDEIYMLAENQAWLNEQAKKGYILKSFDTRYVTFEKGESQDNDYKIVVLDEENAENQINSIEKQGFTFVSKFKEYHVFYIEKKENISQLQLNHDMVDFISKWFNKQIKSQIIIAFLFISFWACFFIVKRSLGWYSDGIVVGFLFRIPNVSLVIYIAIVALIFIKIIKEILVLLRLKKFFIQNNNYLSVRGKTKSRLSKSINIYFLFFIIFIVNPSVNLYMDYIDDFEVIPINEAPEDISIVTIENLLEDVVTSYEIKILEDEKKDNYVIIDSNLLAPKQYYSWQTYLYKDKCGIIKVYYYEAISKILAKKSSKELINDAVNKKHRDKIKKMESSDFEDVYVYEEDYNTVVCVYKDKKIMCIDYDGTIKPTYEKVLEEIAEVL